GAERADHPGGAAHGGGDVVELEVGEHLVAEVLERGEHVRADRAVELEPELGHPEPRLHLTGQAQRHHGVVHVEADGEAGPHGGGGAGGEVDGLGHRVGSFPWAAPTLSAIVRRPVRADQASSSASTRAGARGSAKVAVPTWTAEAPARSSSAASSPRATPPTPTIGRSGSAAWTSCTARTATGWVAGPGRPPPRSPEPGRKAPGSGSMAMPRTVFTSVTASAPAARAASAIGTRSVTLGLSFAQRGRPQAAAAATASWVALALWANRSRAASVLGHDRFTSTATTQSGASARSWAAASYSATLRPQ